MERSLAFSDKYLLVRSIVLRLWSISWSRYLRENRELIAEPARTACQMNGEYLKSNSTAGFCESANCAAHL
jgi:hypothetical protein